MKRIKDPWLKDQAKDQSVLVGPVRRFVESQPANYNQEARATGIHPSSLARDDFCVRATFYDLVGAPLLHPGKVVHRITSILDEGSSIHDKWQGWAWDMGTLVGMFGCLLCRQAHADALGELHLVKPEEWTWWDTAPKECPRCGVGRHFLRYLEIPVHDPETWIVGHADIRVGKKLGEIKSVGLGSVEIEMPRLYNRNVHKLKIEGEDRTLVDFRGIWNGLKRPFLAHSRQLQLYLHLTGLDDGFVLYETKWNQAPKEFPVPYSYAVVEPMLELCADVRYAVGKDKPPVCNQDSLDGCSQCRAYEEAA